VERVRKVVVDRGSRAKLRIVWGRAANGRYHGEAFFEGECDEDQRSKLEAIFNIVAEQGFVRDTKKYRYPLEGCGNIGEFKTFKKRLYFYREGNDLIITHGSTKKTDKMDPMDIERAQRILKEIEAQETELRRGMPMSKQPQRGRKS
jgi:hypothetical protein